VDGRGRDPLIVADSKLPGTVRHGDDSAPCRSAEPVLGHAFSWSAPKKVVQQMWAAFGAARHAAERLPEFELPSGGFFYRVGATADDPRCGNKPERRDFHSLRKIAQRVDSVASARLGVNASRNSSTERPRCEHSGTVTLRLAVANGR